MKYVQQMVSAQSEPEFLWVEPVFTTTWTIEDCQYEFIA